ncbi:MAG: SDR family oxidoreductase [Acidobacteriia bacterium]|nr:SDR family oxidoreductase [Terriglobia bacterium]
MTTPKLASSDLPSFRLDGRLAVITGASQGIGRTFALAYAQAGAELILAGRNAERLGEVRRAIEGAGGRAHTIAADLGTMDGIRSLERDALKIIDSSDRQLILVNSAGFNFTKVALEVTGEDWDQVLNVHAKATFFCSQFMGKQMIARKYGKIISLSSTWSTSTDLGKSIYGIAKAGVSYMTAALSTEWAPLGVRVNAIAPTTTLTENTGRIMRENEARAKRLHDRIVIGRFAEPEDLVGAGIFLASPASDFVTGHTLFVDGGWHAGG